MPVPRAGLSGGEVVAAAAGLADEIGYAGLTMGLLAERLGVRTPSLYKHVGGLDDLQHKLATLAMTEVGDVIRDAVQGRSGADALAALLHAVRGYVTRHPGRYTATAAGETAGSQGQHDTLLAATTRVL